MQKNKNYFTPKQSLYKILKILFAIKRKDFYWDSLFSSLFGTTTIVDENFYWRILKFKIIRKVFIAFLGQLLFVNFFWKNILSFLNDDFHFSGEILSLIFAKNVWTTSHNVLRTVKVVELNFFFLFILGMFFLKYGWFSFNFVIFNYMEKNVSQRKLFGVSSYGISAAKKSCTRSNFLKCIVYISTLGWNFGVFPLKFEKFQSFGNL